MSLDPQLRAPVLARLGPADVPDALGFLERDPVLHVYLIALVLRDALARPKDEYWVARRDGAITAMLYLGGNSGAVLPVGDDREGLRALGALAAGRLEMLPKRFQVVGTATAFDALLERFPERAFAPRLVRRQYYLATDAARLRAPEPLPELRLARREDYAFLYETGAALRAEELLEDPREVDPVAYARRAEEDCRDGHTYVWRDARGLVFRASVSARTADAVQISGVYVPPEHRGRGIATRALGEMCGRLLERSQAACLFVNDFNAPAIAVYERLGFTDRRDWASAFYEQPRD